jgi:dTDP-glucose 4,6-dehydratase
LPTIVTRSSNNLGPYQFPEKLVPLTVRKALTGEILPVYGNGENLRDWLYVDDHVEALLLALAQGRPGETYNVAGGETRRNVEVVRHICAILDEMVPESPHRPHGRLIRFVEDRPGHDAAYVIDAAKIERELGWRPRESFDSALRKTVAWYVENGAWCRGALATGYRGERLGLPARRRPAVSAA